MGHRLFDRTLQIEKAANCKGELDMEATATGQMDIVQTGLRNHDPTGEKTGPASSNCLATPP